MKRLLLPLLAALAFPTAVNSEILKIKCTSIINGEGKNVKVFWDFTGDTNTKVGNIKSQPLGERGRSEKASLIVLDRHIEFWSMEWNEYLGVSLGFVVRFDRRNYLFPEFTNYRQYQGGELLKNSSFQVNFVEPLKCVRQNPIFPF